MSAPVLMGCQSHAASRMKTVRSPRKASPRIRSVWRLTKPRSASVHEAPTEESFSTVAPSANAALELREERGVAFITGAAFYRAESCPGRDLAVLAAALQRQRTGSLRVLDVMAGSGMRGARYLTQADADEVWINDGSTELHDAMVYNMCTAAGLSLPSNVPSIRIAALQPSEQHSPEPTAVEGGAVAGPRLTGHHASADRIGPPLELQLLRGLAAHWEEQAQRLRLEGLARDVWQWDLKRPPSDGNGCGCSGDGDAGSSSCGTSSSRGISGRTATASGVVCAGHDGEQVQASVSGRRVRISHTDANRLLTNCYMRESYYDLVDVDSFGSESMHFPAAIDAVRYGGLLYLTSTDGFTSSGKRPARGLAAYGSYLRATPWANEQGLRMIIGAAMREAAARGVTLTPVFSLYSYHGPVFRVLLRATRSADWPARHYGFMGHCFVHGDNYTVGWRGLGAATCRCESRGRRRAVGVAAAAMTHGSVSASTGASESSPDIAVLADIELRDDARAASVNDDADGAEAAASEGHSGGSGTPLVLSGPLWTGPLHDAAELRAIAAEAARRGWTGFGLDAATASHLRDRKKSSRNVMPLEELLKVMLEEADPRLPPGFFSIDDSVARRMARPPPRDALIAALRQEGFAAARCHLEARAFRTDACMADVVRVAEERLGIPRRPARR